MHRPGLNANSFVLGNEVATDFYSSGWYDARKSLADRASQTKSLLNDVVQEFDLPQAFVFETVLQSGDFSN